MPRRRHLPADLVAVTGDIVQDEPEAYGMLELLLDDIGAPVLLIPGNHDVPAEMHGAGSYGRRSRSAEPARSAPGRS